MGDVSFWSLSVSTEGPSERVGLDLDCIALRQDVHNFIYYSPRCLSCVNMT